MPTARSTDCDWASLRLGFRTHRLARRPEHRVHLHGGNSPRDTGRGRATLFCSNGETEQLYSSTAAAGVLLFPARLRDRRSRRSMWLFAPTPMPIMRKDCSGCSRPMRPRYERSGFQVVGLQGSSRSAAIRSFLRELMVDVPGAPEGKSLEEIADGDPGLETTEKSGEVAAIDVALAQSSPLMRHAADAARTLAVSATGKGRVWGGGSFGAEPRRA